MWFPVCFILPASFLGSDLAQNHGLQVLGNDWVRWEHLERLALSGIDCLRQLCPLSRSLHTDSFSYLSHPLRAATSLICTLWSSCVVALLWAVGHTHVFVGLGVITLCCEIPHGYHPMLRRNCLQNQFILHKVAAFVLPPTYLLTRPPTFQLPTNF